MSFAEEVKNEIAHCKPENAACRFAELAALLCMGGSLILGSRGTIGIEFSTSNNAVARKALKMWMESFTVRPEVRVRQGLRLRKKNYYILRVTPSPESTAILRDLSLFPTDAEFSAIDLRKADCQRAFLRGAFMGGGSVNQPKGDYHLELVTPHYHAARQVSALLMDMELPAGQVMRRGIHVLYYKDSASIEDFLSACGATGSAMDLMLKKVERELRNDINRKVNCETANLTKTVGAAARQIAAIERLQAAGILEKLPAPLRQTANLRLSNPELSLAELCAASPEPISRPGLNNRLRRLVQLGEEADK